MTSLKQKLARSEFGDFQTPMDLARSVCTLLARHGTHPTSILEPTCGVGNFLIAAAESFPCAQRVLGAEIDSKYVAETQRRLRAPLSVDHGEIIQSDFFSTDWKAIADRLPEPVLIIGNPPWVTNAALGSMKSSNLPQKSNFQNHPGIDALTGKSNFDISEWMLIRLLEVFDGRTAIIAMLCKLAVARKVLKHGWKKGVRIARADVYPFDAVKYFNASVEACLLVCALSPSGSSTECSVHKGILDESVECVFGFRDRRVVADTTAFEQCHDLLGPDELYKWRSGIKHDSSRVMVFRKEAGLFRNGLGELTDLEDPYMFPLLKSSDLANGPAVESPRWVLVPQRSAGDNTAPLRHLAPRAWKYLLDHSEALDGRASSIYKGRPRFSIFGVGDYSFAPWKVAISGLYKQLQFKVVGPLQGKPVVFDDTCYFVPCRSKEEASYIASILNSEPAGAFYRSLIFWDAKRPITADILAQLNLRALSQKLGSWETLRMFVSYQPYLLTPEGAPGLPICR